MRPSTCRFLLFLFLFSTAVSAQEVRVGFSGAIITGTREISSGVEDDINNFGLVGLDVKYVLGPERPLIIGVLLRYGSKTLGERNPVFPPASQLDRTGLLRELSLYTLELPVMYRKTLSRKWSFHGGIQVGYAAMKVNETVSFFENNTDVVIGQAAGSTSASGLLYTPLIEFAGEMDIPLFITFSIGYRFLEFNSRWESDADFNSTLDPFLTTAGSRFDLDGLYINAGIQFRIWEVLE